MTAATTPLGQGERIARVSTLELFFDLVFVLTITQLSEHVLINPNVRGFAEAGVLLAVVFYMYGGYAWLTNEVAADGAARRLALLAGMGGFLLVALGIPVALEGHGHGLAFGLGYLLVVAIHAGLFARSSRVHVVRAILRILPINVAVALLALAATVAGGDAGLALMAAAAGVAWIGSFIREREQSDVAAFEIGAEHFTERHGLVVLIAIGESVVAIGAALSGEALKVSLLVSALLALALCAALWWTYFGGDDERAARALGAVDPHARTRAALLAFGHLHLVMLLGIVAAAAGLHHLVDHPTHAAPAASAWLLALGGALFLIGDAGFRGVLGIGRGAARLIAAAALLVAGPLAAISGAVAIIGALAVFAGLFAVEARSAARI